MIKPNHHRIYHWFFNHYINHILKRHFHEIKIVANFEVQNQPVLLIPNHFSWWDGFFAWHINEHLIHKKFHIMMLEEELRKNLFFAKLGAFSINKSSRDILESISYCRDVLGDSNNLLVFYPQGKLFSNHVQKVVFERGIDKIVAGLPSTTIIMAVILCDYYSNKKPSITIALKHYESPEKFNLATFETEYNQFYKTCIVNQDKLFKQ